MLGSAEEAEDAVQQTFLSAYNDLMASDKPIHLRAWLFTIARNRCYSILRARREQPVGELEEMATEGLATQVQRRQDLRDLVTDLQRLPEDQRAALVLAEMDSLGHDQIATVLGVPREKVKALVFQARESLVASRAARETDCSEIREQLANLSGGALRRGNLKRHLRECSGCRDFRHQVERQRRMMRVVLPVAPTLALKDTILAATVGGSGAGVGVVATGGGGGAVATSLLKGSVVKGIVGAALAGVGTAGTLVAVQEIQTGVASRPTMHPLVMKAPFTPARVSAATVATGSAAVATAGGASAAPSSSSTRSGTAAYASSSGATGTAAALAGLSGAAARQADGTARSTRLAVLNPLSRSGLGAGSRDNPLSRVGSTPAAPAPPVESSPGTGSGLTSHVATTSSGPYLGSSAFGSGSQSATGHSRSEGSKAQGGSSTSSGYTPPSSSSGTSSSASGSGYTPPSSSSTRSSSGYSGSSGSSGSSTTTTHSSGGRSSQTADGSSSSGPSIGSRTGSTGSSSSGTSSSGTTPSAPTTTTPVVTSTPTSTTPPTTTSPDPTSSDGGQGSGDSGSGYGGGSDTGPHGR